jgi:hypothetical protein
VFYICGALFFHGAVFRTLLGVPQGVVSLLSSLRGADFDLRDVETEVFFESPYTMLGIFRAEKPDLGR